MRTWKSLVALAALSLAWASPALALQGTTGVKGPKATCAGTNPYNVAANGGWAFSPSVGADYDLVVGPLVPPAGAGSLSETTLAAGPVMAAVNINPNFAGQPLAGLALVIGGLTYNVLDLPAITAQNPTFVIFVDLDGNGSTDDQIIFFPAANGCNSLGAWSLCSPLPAGNFFNANPAADPDGNPATPFTFLQYIAFNGAAVLPATPNPSIGLLLGIGPPPVGGGANAFADNLIL